ncbi:MAG TPA: hypothetical protein VIO83_10250 [Pseudomonas sp.]
MSNATPAVILGGAIMAAAAIYVAPSVIDDYQNQNIIITTNGAVRLGKVYNEALKVRMEMKNTETGEVFISVDEDVDGFYKQARSELEKLIHATNEGAKSDKEKISVEAAGLKVHMTITLDTYFLYRSEYQPSFSLTVDQHEISAGVNSGINKVLMQTQEYLNEVKIENLEKNRFLKL